MIKGANATVFVSDLDRAVQFYRDVLGLKLQFQAGKEFAQFDAGSGTMIALHPAGPHSPKPGSRGAIQVGFGLDQPLDQVVKTLQGKGVAFRGPIVDDPPVRLAFFGDLDGNDLYLCEYGGQGSYTKHA